MELNDYMIEQFASPGKLVGHLSYALLVFSMLMRSMKKLRMIAIGAGVVSAIYGWFWLQDFVTVFWEVIFVSVNLIQLLILEWENHRARFSQDEQRFIDHALPHAEKAHARRVLRIADHREIEDGKFLTIEDEKVSELFFILEGAVRIDQDGKMVGVCGHDDFVGEIAFMTGDTATATAVVTNSVRCFAFDAEKLTKVLQREPHLRHSLEASFNRNLVGKLIKSNHGRRQADQIVAATE